MIVSLFVGVITLGMFEATQEVKAELRSQAMEDNQDEMDDPESKLRKTLEIVR